VLPAPIRKCHLAKLAHRKDWVGIRKDEQTYGKIPDDVKAAIGIGISSSGNITPSAETRPMVLLWGIGNPRREFLHVDDLEDACVFLSAYKEKKCANLSSTTMHL
jgi:GDP-L-fucose synthase